MKMKAAVLPLLAVPFFVMTSCGSAAVTENTIELKKDGKVVEYIVEDFEASYYDADEMKSFIDSQVEAYLEDSDGSIKVSKDKVEDEVAYVTIVYDSADTYADFTGAVLYAGGVLQAQTVGYDFDTNFISAEDATKEDAAEEDADAAEEDADAAEEDTDAAGEDDLSVETEAQEDTSSAIEGTVITASCISGSEILEEDDLNVLITDTDVTVIVPGTVKYVSAEGVTVTGSDTVSVQIPGSADTPVYILYE
ncbi:MAG: hypothetical protein LUC83_04130 [Clostridiales bacterium]|nr:hypothetical protein [Clostridiales bacterium]